MALDKKQIFLSAEAGLDTKTDDKNSIETTFTLLENVRFTETGKWQKRFGFSETSPLRIDATNMPSANTLLTYSNNTQVAFSGTTVNDRSSTASKWINRGNFFAGNTDEAAVATNQFQISELKSKTAFGYNAYCYTDTNGDTRYVIKDQTTDSVLVNAVLESSITQNPQVAVVGTKFLFFYIKSFTLFYKAVDVSSITTLGSAVSVATGISANSYMVHSASTDRVYAFYAATDMKALYIDSALTASTAITVEATTTTPKYNIDVNEEGANIRFCYVKSGVGLQTVLYNANLTSTVHGIALIHASPANNYGIATAPKSTSTDIYYTFLTGANTQLIEYNNVDSSGTVGGPVIVRHNCVLQSKIVQQTTDSGQVDLFVAMRNGQSESVNTTFGTYFVCSRQTGIVTKYEIRNGRAALDGGASDYTSWFSFNAETANNWRFTGIKLAEVQDPENTGSNPTTGSVTITDYFLEYKDTRKLSTAELGKNLHIADTIGTMFDGYTVTEQAFLETPGAIEVTSITNSAGGGATVALGDLTAGSSQSYSWCVVFSWKDAYGQIHRSAPGPVHTQQILSAAPPPYKRVTMRLPVLAFTNKSNVTVELYRTTANGTTFYKVFQNDLFAAPPVNDPSLPYITITDDWPDFEIIKHEILYTTGGVLENDTMPNSKFLTVYGDRIFALASKGDSLYFTKKNVLGSPPEFNLGQYMQVPEKGGPAVALGVLDSSCIIFKQNNIFTFAGDGPNDLGEQSDYRTPQEVTVDVGCSEPESICQTPLGIVFKSLKGIYMLERNFNVKYIGAPVEEFNSLSITSAKLLENTTEIFFTTSSNRWMTYDYFHNRWTTDVSAHSNMTTSYAVDSSCYNGVKHVMFNNAQMFRELTNNYADDQDVYVSMKLSTAWIKLGQMQLYKRLYELMLLGTYYSPHNLTVQIAYDYDNTVRHEVTFAAIDDDYYQYRIYSKLQKCDAFKITIFDSHTITPQEVLDGVSQQGYDLSNIGATIGLKSGLNKLSPSKEKGAS